MELVVERRPQFGRGVDEQVVDDRGAAVVGDPVLGDQPVDRRSLHGSQADVRSGVRRHRPGEAPTVAVEHRQRPQVHAVPRHVPGEDVPHGVEVSAAVVHDDALRVARGARGVVQGDGLPLVGRLVPVVPGVRGGEQGLVLLVADRLARAGVLGVVDVHHCRRPVQCSHGPGREAAEGAVDEQDLRLAVFEDERDSGGVEAGVERHEDGPGHRDPEVGLDHLGGVRQQDRHGVAPSDAPRAERGRQPTAPVTGRAPAVPTRPVHDREVLGIHVCAPVKEHQRCQRSEVRRPTSQPDLEVLDCHGSSRAWATGPPNLAAAARRREVSAAGPALRREGSIAIGIVPSRPHPRGRSHCEASGRHAAAVGSATAAPSARPRMPPCRRAASRGQGSAGGCAPGSHHGQPRSWPQADPRAATVDRRRSVAGQQVRRQPRRRGRRRNRTQPLDRNSTSASGHRTDPPGRHRTDC